MWSPDCGIIVTGNSAFDTLIIQPGTEIQIDPGVGIAFNHIQAVGKPDSMIVFTKNQNSYGTWQELRNSGSNTAVLEYCIIEYGGRSGSTWGGPLLAPEGKISLNNCVVRYCHSYYGTGWNIITLKNDAYVKNSVFTNSFSNLAIVGIEDDNWTGTFEFNVIHDNRYQQYYGEQPFLTFRTQNDLDRIENNSFFRHNYNGYGSNRNTGYVLGVRDGNGGGHGLNTYVGNYLDSNYFGFSNSLSISQNIFDFQEESSYPAVDGSTNALQSPKLMAHGHVWRIMVDDTLDININDNPIHNILDLGTHKAKVYFNRPMDVTRTPFVTYGVRNPWTQNIVGDSASWSADSMMWTGYFDITQLTASDGYNTLSVRHAYDNESFITPIEDYRFQFRINVAGALSTGFAAVGDTSEIRLSWQAPDSIVDLIGYNILRLDTTQASYDTLIINTALVMDTNYTDQNVVGGEYYLYFYVPVRSSFTESQRSIGVWATPYASKPRVKTLKAAQPSSNQLAFNAGVDANFISTDARIEFGLNKSNLSNATAWENIGSNYFEVPYAKSIQSVTPGKVYYYRAQAKNDLGTTSGEIDSILTKSTPGLTITGPTEICFGDSLQLSVNSTSPDTTLVLTWSINGVSIGQGEQLSYLPSGSGQQTILVSADGDFTNSTSGSHDYIITTSGAPIPISYSGSTAICQGSTLSLALPSGYENFTWNTGDTTSAITVSQSGTYSATMTSVGAGCSFSSNSLSIAVNPLPVSSVTTASGDFDFCDGSSLTLQAPAGQSGYQWYKDGSTVTGATSETLSAVASGSYTIQVTNADGCSSLSAAQTVTKNVNPTAIISAGSALSFCDGGSVTLTGPSNMSYLWSDASTSQSLVLSSSGQVGLTITDANGCSATASTVDVNVFSVPTLAVTAASSTSICQGESVTLQASGGFSSYAWSSGASNQNLIVNAAGSYSVTGTTSDGCTTTSSAQSVTVNALPTAIVTNNGASLLCSGLTTTLSAPIGMTYLWSNGDTTQTITISTSGSYDVTVTNASGCSATSGSTLITTSQVTVPTVVASGVTEFCEGGDVILAIPSGFASYTWNTGSGFSQLTATQSGSYFATVSNTDGCTVNSDTVIVTVFPTPLTPSISYAANDTVMVSSIADGNQWYFNGILITGETGTTLRPVNLGNYSVRIIDSNGCEGDMSAMQFYNSIGIVDNLASQVNLYPNPSNGLVTLELGAIDVLSIKIYDAKGRLLNELNSCPGNCRIDLGAFEDGMYQLVLMTTQGQTVTKAVVLQK